MDYRSNGSLPEQKEWIIPCNTDYYDIDNALISLKIIDWKQPVQMNNARIGDLVYIYCKSAGKTGNILFKGAIIAVNKTEKTIDDSEFALGSTYMTGPYCTLAVFRVYELGEELSYSKLKESGLKSRLQSPVIVKGTLAEYLHSCDERQRQIDRFEASIPEQCLEVFPIAINENGSSNNYYYNSRINNAAGEYNSMSDLYKDVKDGIRNAWVYSPGEKGSMLGRFVEAGIAGIDWWSFDFGDLNDYDSQESIAEYMRCCKGSEESFKNDSLCLFQFSHEMKVGDVLFCKGGLHKLIGVGVVTAPYFYSDTYELGRFSNHYNCIVDTYRHRIRVEWLTLTQRVTDFALQLKTLTKLRSESIDRIFDLYRDVDLCNRILPLDNTHSDEERLNHAKALSLNELRDVAERQQNRAPQVFNTTVVQRLRDPYIAEYSRRRARGVCQLCGLPAPFNKPDGSPYLESHHIVWLSIGGEDSIENTVALCPNCHRKMHVVGDPVDINKLINVNRTNNS